MRKKSKWISSALFIFGSITITSAVEATKDKPEEKNSDKKNEKVRKKEKVKSEPFFKERIIEKNNFSHYVREQNKATFYGQADINSKTKEYEWVIEGYQSLSPSWDLNYKFKRGDEDTKSNSIESSYLESEISLDKSNDDKEIFGKVWNYGTVLGMKMNESTTKEVTQVPVVNAKDPKNMTLIFKTEVNKEKQRDFKFYVGQRISSFYPEIGLGGTKVDIEGNIGAVLGNNKNGYSILGAVKTKTNLGYGVQLLNNAEVEFLDYNVYDSALRAQVDSTVRWTYEFTDSWAFSPEVNIKAEKYFSTPNGMTTYEATVSPNLLYTQNINRNVRLFGKFGLPVYKYEQKKYKDTKITNSNIGGFAKMGIEYTY